LDDAKNPNVSRPAVQSVRPLEEAPNMLVVLTTRLGGRSLRG
jgi:hypothetical protein